MQSFVFVQGCVSNVFQFLKFSLLLALLIFGIADSKKTKLKIPKTFQNVVVKGYATLNCTGDVKFVGGFDLGIACPYSGGSECQIDPTNPGWSGFVSCSSLPMDKIFDEAVPTNFVTFTSYTSDHCDKSTMSFFSAQPNNECVSNTLYDCASNTTIRCAFGGCAYDPDNYCYKGGIDSSCQHRTMTTCPQ